MEERVQWRCEEVTLWPPITSNRITDAVISEMWPIGYEQKLINEYNNDNPKADLRAYSTFLDYLKHDELREPMEKLIEKYNIKFYTETEDMVEWEDWKLIIGNREYPTPYADKDEWKATMEEREAKDSARLMQKRMDEIFSGELYNELNKILQGGTNEPTTSNDRGSVDSL